MILFPAIDINQGKVVRLSQGDYDQVTQYSEDPVGQARRFASQGAQWLHVVDLDAAKTGRPVNANTIESIAKETGLKVQVGGGIRHLKMAEKYLEAGVARVVVGTAAIKDQNFLKILAQSFPNRVALGLDTKGDQMAIEGWTEMSGKTWKEYLKTAPLEGVACLIFTDIARDGMLTGPNLQSLIQVLKTSPIPVIASGGISSTKDLQSLKDLQHPNLLGAIVGKALYEGKFTLKEALVIAGETKPSRR